MIGRLLRPLTFRPFAATTPPAADTDMPLAGATELCTVIATACDYAAAIRDYDRAAQESCKTGTPRALTIAAAYKRQDEALTALLEAVDRYFPQGNA